MIKKSKIFLKVITILIIVFLYFFVRLQGLDKIPVFGDEAIYVRWAQIIKAEETLRFIPQSDGKQPLFMWLMAASFKFISDPLITGRLISVFSGFGNLITIFIIICVVLSFSKKETNPIKFLFSSIKNNFYIGSLSSFIYIFLPFTFFFDRLALADSLLSFFGSLSLLLSLLLAKFKRLDLSLLLGITLGLAWLTKSPAIYFIALSFLTYLVFNYKNIKSYYLPIISSGIACVIYNILRLGPQFNMISSRNKDYIWSFSEILKHPLDPLKPHLSDTLTLYGNYISWLLIIFAIVGLVLFLFYQKNTPLYVISLWWILPLIANAAIAKVFTARYILYTLPPLIIILSLGLSVFFKNSLLKLIFIFLILVPNLIWIKNISSDPFNFNLPGTEAGYLRDWTSGWGIKESADYLKQRSLEKNVIVGTEGYFGTLPDGLQIYANKVPQLTIIGVGLGFNKIPNNLIDAKNHGDEVYLLINQSRLKLEPSETQKLKLIKSFSKPAQDQLLLFQL